MISLETRGNHRVYRLPAGLQEVAQAIFPEAADPDEATFQLFQCLVSDDLATLENIAALRGQEAAVDFARRRLVRRPAV